MYENNQRIQDALVKFKRLLPEDVKLTPLNYFAHRPEKYSGAILSAGGNIAFYKNGMLHREDGPAVIWNGGEFDFYLDNSKVSFQDFFETLSNQRKVEIIWEMDQWI